MTATASDPDGTVAGVDFYQGANKLGTKSAPPYTWTVYNVPVGSYSGASAFTARATDNQGATTTSNAVAVTVSTVNKPPVVALTAPANGAVYTAPATIVMTATASDPDGTVAGVDFYQGANKLGTKSAPPYTWTVYNVPVGNYSGASAFTARATDNQGATTTSNAVAVTVSTVNKPPVVALTAPANGASYTAPATIVMTATASDPDGTVAGVDFYQGANKLGTKSAPPYTWTVYNVPVGSYSGASAFTARATDNQGATTTSNAVAVTVSTVNKPPLVTLTAPANGAVYTAPATIVITASASDPDGTIALVELFQGANKVGSKSAPPYTWTVYNVPVGNYSGANALTARATDNQGATTTSNTVAVTVSSTVNKPPVVTLTAPTNGAVYTVPTNITLTASAFDPDGTIALVEFYQGANKLGSKSAPPYTLTIYNAPAGYYSGAYALTARATDNAGAVTTSNAVAITITK